MILLITSAMANFGVVGDGIGSCNYPDIESAIVAAGPGGRVALKGSTTHRVDRKITIAHDVRIEGGNAYCNPSNGATATIDWDDTGYFHVNGSTTLELDQLVLVDPITGPSWQYGNHVFVSNSGSLIATDVDFQGTLDLTSWGGSVYVGYHADFTCTDCTFSGGYSARGGAIYLNGNAELISSVFTGNNASQQGGAV